MEQSALPIGIIGGGPIGLAAAAHLAQRGQSFILFEAGETIAANVRGWGHVRVFTPWRYLVDKAAHALLDLHGWSMPDQDAHPTGHELIDRYLQPLASLPEIQPYIRYGARVVSVARLHYDRMKTPGREKMPFVITSETSDGVETQVLVRGVIDASGGKANPLGANGRPALGEHALQNRIFYGIPDVLGTYRARYADKKVLVVGSGHSAFNAVLDLITLAENAPGTEITWAVRRDSIGQMFGGGAGDELAARGRLGLRAETAMKSGRVRFVAGARITRLEAAQGGAKVYTHRGAVGAFDEIIGATGFRPDFAPLSEIRHAIHDSTEAVPAIAPLIDPNFHSCGTVPPHGVEELRQPEQDFYIVGMKSYGRAPTFLMLTGYEQVRSVVAALAGDWEAARQVELTLPDSGVCSTNRQADGCCGGGGQSNLISIESVLILP